MALRKQLFQVNYETLKSKGARERTIEDDSGQKFGKNGWWKRKAQRCMRTSLARHGFYNSHAFSIYVSFYIYYIYILYIYYIYSYLSNPPSKKIKFSLQYSFLDNKRTINFISRVNQRLFGGVFQKCLLNYWLFKEFIS